MRHNPKSVRIILFLSLIVVFLYVHDPALSSSQLGDPAMPLGEDEDKVAEIERFRAERDRFFKSHPRSPLNEKDKREFQGLVYYPISLDYIFSGKIRRYRLHITNPEYYAEFITNRGTYKRYIRYGVFNFALGDREYEVEIYKSILGDNLFIPFKDKTNGTETYAMGRYLDAEILPGYHTVVDFNRAYNPSCVYNSKYVCIIPPEKNFLDVEIRAGEKNYP